MYISDKFASCSVWKENEGGGGGSCGLNWAHTETQPVELISLRNRPFARGKGLGTHLHSCPNKSEALITNDVRERITLRTFSVTSD